MFKKYQDYLLLNRPLLWNTKAVPLFIIMLAIHILFFVVGFTSGAVDFSEDNESYRYDATEGYGVAIGILIGTLVTVLWLVYYLRNNAYKSFYPKNTSSLYKEWLLILVICTMNWSYPLSLIYGRDVRARSYYSEEETIRRTDIISMASLFADGGFQENGDSIVEKPGQEAYNIKVDSFKYGKRYYKLNSLLNKSISDFYNQDNKKDSLNEARVKGWLVENRKDSVLWLFREFDKIVKEHRAPTNLTPEKWLKLVYNYPDFTKYITVGRTYFYESNEAVVPYSPENYNIDYEEVYNNSNRLQDTASNVIKIKNGYTYVYPKFHAPFRQLENAYQDVAVGWANPGADQLLVTIYLYVGLVLSLLIFSFRVTSGRSWLIGIIGYGILALVTGIFNLLLIEVILRGTDISRNGEYLYLGIWILILIALMLYFFSVKKSKGHSDVALNVCLWLTPWLLPVLNMIVIRILDSMVVYKDGVRVTPKSGYEIMMDDYPEYFWIGNVIIFMLFMYLFTAYIKKWKGIPES